jgi:hypothetical protein
VEGVPGVRNRAIDSCDYVFLLMKHAPSLESNTAFCELVGNAGPVAIRVPSLHFHGMALLRLYSGLSSAMLLLEFIEIY